LEFYRIHEFLSRLCQEFEARWANLFARGHVSLSEVLAEVLLRRLASVALVCLLFPLCLLLELLLRQLLCWLLHQRILVTVLHRCCPLPLVRAVLLLVVQIALVLMCSAATVGSLVNLSLAVSRSSLRCVARSMLLLGHMLLPHHPLLYPLDRTLCS
jgi:hypothetical protein